MSTQEPRNGDFVAYIEQLQRESAARLRASTRSQLVELPNTPIGTRDATRQPPAGALSPRAPTAPRPPAGTIETQGPVLNRQQAEELVERLKGAVRNAPRERRPAAGPAIALIVGALMIVNALAGDGGIFPLIAGIGLVVWGFRRLHLQGTAGAAERRRKHEEYKQRVAQTFGKPPSS